MALPPNNSPDWNWSNLVEPSLNMSDTTGPQVDHSDITTGNDQAEARETPDWNALVNFSPRGSTVPDQTRSPASAAEGLPDTPLTHEVSGISDEQQRDKTSPSADSFIEEENCWESRFHSGDFVSKYDFRGKVRESRALFNSTWMDKDESGNYDPSDETRRTHAARKRARLMRERCCRSRSDIVAELEGSDNDDENIELRRKCPEQAKLVVCLHFKSEQKQSDFGKLAESLAQRATLLPSDPRDDCTQGYCLRSQRKDCNSISDESGSVRDLSAVLTGHPAARGCHGCFKLGLRCSLLDDEFKWPCDACEEDGEDGCLLITEPRVKRACERCRKRRWKCSFSETSDHSGGCEKCKANGFGCVAGPAKHALNRRIRYELMEINKSNLSEDSECDQMLDDFATVSTSTSPPSSQDEVKAGSLPGLSKALTTQEVAPLPIATDTISKTVLKEVPSVAGQHVQEAKIRAPTREITNELTKNKPAVIPSSTPIPPQPSRKDGHRPQVDRTGVTKQITTKFCHPIIFNHQPRITRNGRSEDPCHFCDSPLYAILGLGAKTVKVIDWVDGQGLQEMRGGHRSDGVQNTRICPLCTTIRLQIVMCKGHNMRLIPEVEHVKLDRDGELGRLIDSSSKVAWCSVCPAPARHECCTGEQGSEKKGCGLFLCDACNSLLAGHFEGNLQRMLKTIKREPTAQRPLGLRADCELLLEQGLLVRYVLWDSSRA